MAGTAVFLMQHTPRRPADASAHVAHTTATRYPETDASPA